MRTHIDVVVHGIPRPFIRHESRVVRVNGRWSSVGYEPKYKPNPNPASKGYDMQVRWNRLHEWRHTLRSAILPRKPHEPWDGPVKLEVVIYVPRPQELYRPKYPRGCIMCDRKPDADNYGKVVMDVMSECGVWTDDGRVWCPRYPKVYHAVGGGPGVRIRARLCGNAGIPSLWEPAA